MGEKILIENLSKVFPVGQRTVTALDRVSLAAEEGEFVCVVGPSGCGKTTLLLIAAGLEMPSEGSVTVRRGSAANVPVNATIFQETSVLPWMTVRQNVEYGLRMRGLPRPVRNPIVERWIAKVGLTRFADAYPHQLSGGMKQRVSIARAFANDPEVLLMDEPFASLDEQNKLLLQDELMALWAETRKTVIFITHGIDEAVLLGDRVVVMTAHPGRIKAEIPIDLPRPREVSASKALPRFAELTTHVWELLRDEVLRAKREEAIA